MSFKASFHASVARARIVCVVAGAIVAAGVLLVAARQSVPGVPVLDREVERWVTETLGGMTLDEKIGQLLLPSFRSTYTGSDSETYDDLVTLVREYHVGGFHLFGGRTSAPDVLLNPTYGRSTLGQPLAAASLLNRLQAIAPVPLLNTADFEAGVGFRLAGATTFPRAMAFGAARDESLAFQAGRITAVEGRAIGVHVNFAPVVDVNNNPRNPVINTRAFGEDPSLVGRLAAAYVRGLRAGGMLATVKHFPGHGDTDVDSHLGLPIISHPRERLDRVELPPFEAGIAAGARAVMTGHIELPALDPQPGVPTTMSVKIVTGLLRGEMGFNGLIYTDSMRMGAISELMLPGEAAAAAITAGHDVVLHSPDDAAAFAGIKVAVASGQLYESQVDASVERVLRAKASLGLHRARAVSVEAVPEIVGSRLHGVVAREVSERSITLIKDERRQVPFGLPDDAALLYLSVLDYPRRVGDRRAQSDLHSGAEGAMARRDGDRAVRPDVAVGDRVSAADRVSLRCHHRGGLRADLGLQRTDGSGAGARPTAPRSLSIHGASRAAVSRGAVRQPVHRHVPSRAASDDAHLRLLRPCRGVGRAGADGRVGCSRALADRVVGGVSGRPRTGAEGARAGRSAL